MIIEEDTKMITDNTHLVIGGSGFIGSVLCETLLEFGCQVVVVDDDTSMRFDLQASTFTRYPNYVAFKGSVTWQLILISKQEVVFLILMRKRL